MLLRDHRSHGEGGAGLPPAKLRCNPRPQLSHACAAVQRKVAAMAEAKNIANVLRMIWSPHLVMTQTFL
jgi:hypothetical protein